MIQKTEGEQKITNQMERESTPMAVLASICDMRFTIIEYHDSKLQQFDKCFLNITG